MKRFVPSQIPYWFAVFLLVGSALQSVGAACLAPLQAPSQEELQTARQHAHNRGFLWRISKAGHSSYLYGTIHVARLDWAFPGEDVLLAWRATDTMALELNLLDADTLSRVQSGARDFDNRALPAAFTAWVQQQARDNCLDLAKLQAMDPNFQIATITMENARHSGLEAAFGIDLMLTHMASDTGRPIEALETAQEQLDALKSDKEQDGQLADIEAFSADEQERGQKVLLTLATAWEQSDLAALRNYEQWCACMETASDREQLKHLIDDRNVHFAKRIDALHTSGRNVFAAVGSLHLTGAEKAVPDLLIRQGYTVERVF